MKKILLIILLLLNGRLQLLAQNIQIDSSSLKVKTAQTDAKHFKLDQQTWKVYRKYGINYTSDYFKPNTTNSIHYQWFTDSVYVKAFREATYKKTIQRSLIRHYIVNAVKQEIIVTIGIGTILFLIAYAISHPS
ncbi:MAG: hypothetical protein EOP43_04220 [Sphingobacteriaceae bacterium]|nr:MAG: hypothetical protein EOP43_04220 [Sphingobacteriaceae bacterium]